MGNLNTNDLTDFTDKGIIQDFIISFMGLLDDYYNISIILENKKTNKINVAGNTNHAKETLNLLKKGINHYKTALNKNTN